MWLEHTNFNGTHKVSYRIQCLEALLREITALNAVSFPELDVFIAKLDRRAEKSKENSGISWFSLKSRVDSTPTTSPPDNAPAWAILRSNAAGDGAVPREADPAA